jgi:putative membrane protein
MLKILIINSIVVFIGAYILDGVKIKNFWTAIGVAIVLGVINMFIKPLILLLTLPLTILTLGLFVLVINAWILMFIDKMIDGLTIKSFWWAVIYSIIISVLNSFMFWVF